MPQDRLADIERATDKLCKSQPLSVMCQYPGRASMEVFQRVSAEHGAGLRERLLQATPIEGGVAVAGELDISNKNILCSVLLAATTACESETFVLDLSGLGFLDLGGVRTLMAGTDPYRRLGGHVRLQAPQPHVDRLIRILGVDREQGFLTEALA
jgi:anti-anti-sigma factor